MTKDELKQEAEECMHNALFWLKLPISKENVEQGGSYILKLLEPREKHIAELEKENADLKEEVNKIAFARGNLEEENAELEKENNLLEEWRSKRVEEYCKPCIFAIKVDLDKLDKLENENAELKAEWQEQVQKATDEGYARTLQTMQLSKAKEIIKEFVEWANWQGNSKCPSFKSIQDKAEQFLNEVEK